MRWRSVRSERSRKRTARRKLSWWGPTASATPVPPSPPAIWPPRTPSQPFLQGYMVTETAIKYLQGVKVCGKIEERGLIITPSNVKNAERLLKAVDARNRYWESCYSK